MSNYTYAHNSKSNLSPLDIEVINDFVEEVFWSDHVWRLRCRCNEFKTPRPRVHAWCTHIEEAFGHQADRFWANMRSDEDGEFHYDPFTGDQRQAVAVEVPMFRSPSISETVHLTPSEDGTDLYAVSLITDVHLGYVSSVCGRRTMRGLLLEWLVGWADQPPGCSSDLHRGETVPADPQDVKALGNLFSVLRTGWCLDCWDRWPVPEMDK